MRLFDTTYIRDHVDYSFGDQSGRGLPWGYMKPANKGNKEFLKKREEVSSKRDYMTLFIDNIRLYKRDIECSVLTQPPGSYQGDKKYLAGLMTNEDLLALLRALGGTLKYIIFTGFEDVPVDEFIHVPGVIPENVTAIYATNAICYGGKVKPMPYGLQRKITGVDNRIDVLRVFTDARVEVNPAEPKTLLYVNHTVRTQERMQLNRAFSGKSWATVDQPGMKALDYFRRIQEHKFMLCPEGNAVGCDCHRQWEVIYLRRVPVMKRSRYLEKVFDGIPVLFVSDYSDVTPELLQRHDHLYSQMQAFDLGKLDVAIFFTQKIKEALGKTETEAPPTVKPLIGKQNPLHALGIDAVYCINLLRRTDRKAHAEVQFHLAGIEGVQYWPARDGEAEKIKAKHRPEMTYGMVGCFQSHREVLAEAIAAGHECVLITEDDLQFEAGWDYILELALKQLPKDWGFIYLGYTEHGGFGKHKEMINPFWVVPQSVWGLQAYIIRGQENMKKLYAHIQSIRDQIDLQLIYTALPQSGVPYYCIFPSIVGQESEKLITDVQVVVG